MITEQDLREAIAECQGQRNPDAKTCMMLAAFLTIQREMYGKPDNVQFVTPPASFAAPPSEMLETTISYTGESDFARTVDGMNIEKVMSVMDELLTDTLQLINRRLYDAVLRELKTIKRQR